MYAVGTSAYELHESALNFVDKLTKKGGGAPLQLFHYFSNMLVNIAGVSYGVTGIAGGISMFDGITSSGGSQVKPKQQSETSIIENEGGSESVLPPNTKPDFIVAPEGTVMDTSKNYNLVGSGEQGDWFQIHNYGKPEDGFGFPHTHKPQLNTNGTNTSYKRVVSNTTAADIDYADELLRTGKMTFRKKGRR